MSKVAVVYWSGTGNTEQMANFVLEGAKNAGAEAELFPCDAFDSDLVDGFDGIAFGCSAQGDEVIEESEFEPMFSSCEPKLQGKRVALFGSYGWGDGEWMRSWEDRCSDRGISLACESVICNEYPDSAAIDNCKALGAALAG